MRFNNIIISTILIGLPAFASADCEADLAAVKAELEETNAMMTKLRAQLALTKTPEKTVAAVNPMMNALAARRVETVKIEGGANPVTNKPCEASANILTRPARPLDLSAVQGGFPLRSANKTAQNVPSTNDEEVAPQDADSTDDKPVAPSATLTRSEEIAAMAAAREARIKAEKDKKAADTATQAATVQIVIIDKGLPVVDAEGNPATSMKEQAFNSKPSLLKVISTLETETGEKHMVVTGQVVKVSDWISKLEEKCKGKSIVYVDKDKHTIEGGYTPPVIPKKSERDI